MQQGETTDDTCARMRNHLDKLLQEKERMEQRCNERGRDSASTPRAQEREHMLGNCQDHSRVDVQVSFNISPAVLKKPVIYKACYINF